MNALLSRILESWAARRVPSADVLEKLVDIDDLEELAASGTHLAVEGFGSTITYSPKVFIPLTQLCRDVCGYCTFAKSPEPGTASYLRIDEVLAIAQAGAAAGCREALFTLGEKPEQRYPHARLQLQAMGFESTVDYLACAARLVFEKTGLLPHLNPGVLSPSELEVLKPHAVSMGLMLESLADRLAKRPAAHWKAPDKVPRVRLQTLNNAGELQIPYTTGILVGIGETRMERVAALLAIRDVHQRYGHIQEVIVQNFRAKPGTRMALHPEPSLTEFCWSIAAARLILGPEMSLQAPPNLSPGECQSLVQAGINDWGGISPVTIDHVNPEAPWPHLADLKEASRAAGRVLTPRLAIVPSFAKKTSRWLQGSHRIAVRRAIDTEGFARRDAWYAGSSMAPPGEERSALQSHPAYVQRARHFSRTVRAAQSGHPLHESAIAALFTADGDDFAFICRAADELRRDLNGNFISYVINRNINYTNVCRYRCGFCAFAKGRSSESLRGPAYTMDDLELTSRVREAALRGATEVCLQGGIHPRFDGNTYLDILRSAKKAAPHIHVHAFSPLEIQHGATSLHMPLQEYLTLLKDNGLATLPGTAAEILDDEVRAILCPDKLSTEEWLAVMREAHRIGLRSTATIMFGHVDTYQHWAKHLLRIRRLQEETGGFNEFVPLPFVHMESPIWRSGNARSGPTFREAILMHAVARLVLHPMITNIQASWVKMGIEGALLCCSAGANDLGGTLMDESITRAAGGVNGQAQDATTLSNAIGSLGRTPRQRTTNYAEGALEARAAN